MFEMKSKPSDAALEGSKALYVKPELVIQREQNSFTRDHSGFPATRGGIDGFVSNCIAPNHLLTGLDKGLFPICIGLIANEYIRKNFYILLYVFAKDMGSDGRHSLYRVAIGAFQSMSTSFFVWISTAIPILIPDVAYSNQTSLLMRFPYFLPRRVDDHLPSLTDLSP